MKLSKPMMLAGIFAVGASAGLFRMNVKLAQADCSLAPADFAQIATIQNDPTLNYQQEVGQELALRKQLVGETIDCAEASAQTARAAVASASTTSASIGLQTTLLGKFDDAQNFYEIERAKLNGSGIAGTQAVAGEILAWREGSYDPLVAEANNFLLWSGNQNLFGTAQARMDQTARAVSFVENTSPDADLQNSFVAAQSSLGDAENENAAALTALMQFLPPDQSLALIKQSLDSLSSTYQQFGTESTIIGGLLSH